MTWNAFQTLFDFEVVLKYISWIQAVSSSALHCDHINKTNPKILSLVWYKLLPGWFCIKHAVFLFAFLLFIPLSLIILVLCNLFLVHLLNLCWHFVQKCTYVSTKQTHYFSKIIAISLFIYKTFRALPHGHLSHCLINLDFHHSHYFTLISKELGTHGH